MLTKSQAATHRVLQLEKEITDLRFKKDVYDKAYFVDDDPLVSDAEYDQLLEHLTQLEKMYFEMTGQEYNFQSSNLNSYGGPVVPDGVVRDTKMYSLFKVHNESDLVEFLTKSLKDCQSDDELFTEILASIKLDGVAIEAIYQNSELVQILTRGHNGWIGEDITEARHMFTNLPDKLYIQREIFTDSFEVPSRLEVRGEAVINKESFNRINRLLAEKNERQYASPRHMVSGFLRNRNNEPHLSESIEFMAYGIGKISHVLLDKYRTLTIDDYGDYSVVLETLFALGFDLVPGTSIPFDYETMDITRLNSFFLDQEKNRYRYQYSADGVVFVFNSGTIREILGYTEHHPNWAVAYKFPPEMAMTKILNIVLQVGRTGKITPVAIVDPIKLSGVVITRATLSNPDYVSRNDFRIGDTVVLQRSGDVIPKIIKHFDPKRSEDSKPFYIPTGCPVCGSSSYQKEGVKDVYCTNFECPAVIKYKIVYAASKGCLDIMGLGHAHIEGLLELGILNNVSDIFNLKMSDFISISLSEKVASKILAQIEKAKKEMTLTKFISSLCIPNIGTVNARILADHFNNLHDLMNADKYMLSTVKGIGSSIATDIYDYFRSPPWLSLSEDFKKLGMSCGNKNNGLLNEINVAITGSFKKINRNNIISILTKYGAKIQGSVNKRTTFILVGNKEQPGNKLNDALELRIPIWEEEDILTLIFMLEKPEISKEVLLEFIEHTSHKENREHG